jgi:hypothetical protein
VKAVHRVAAIRRAEIVLSTGQIVEADCPADRTLVRGDALRLGLTASRVFDSVISKQ